MRALAIVVLIVPAIAVAQPKQPVRTAGELLKLVEATYKAPKQLTASFEQTVFNPAMGTTATTKGTLVVAKPDKMRWDYIDKKGKTKKQIIFDGKTAWMIEPLNTQIIKHEPKTSELPGVIAFFMGAGSLAKDFDVAFPKPQQAHVVPGAQNLVLTPRQANAAYAEIYLAIDPSTWTVARTTIVNCSGVASTYAFSGVDMKKSVDAKLFAFDAKAYPGFKIITP